MMTAPITVTAHALVRWGSRVMGLDCAEHLRQDSKRVGHLRRNPAFQISAGGPALMPARKLGASAYAAWRDLPYRGFVVPEEKRL